MIEDSVFQKFAKIMMLKLWDPCCYNFLPGLFPMACIPGWIPARHLAGISQKYTLME